MRQSSNNQSKFRVSNSQSLNEYNEIEQLMVQSKDKELGQQQKLSTFSSVMKAAVTALGFNSTSQQPTTLKDTQSAEILKSSSTLGHDSAIDSIEYLNDGVDMEVDSTADIKKPNPLQIPEILTHILSFLESPPVVVSDPTQPIDFVKVDSMKYTISRPKLHQCALVSKLWNECCTKMLWKNIKIGTEKGVERMSKTLGSSTKGGQIGRYQNNVNLCWGSSPETCKFHLGFKIIPSIVNGWNYGFLMRSLSLMPSHGINQEQFLKWNLDYLISLVAITCPNLEELILSSCMQVTDKSMVLIARHCRNLKKLNLNRCDQVSTATIEELAKSCKKLEVLNLSRPLMNTRTQISDEAILKVVKANPGIIELRLRNCDNLSDKSVIELSKSLSQNLLALDLSWCSKLTDRAIVEGLSAHCQKLKSLSLNGCKLLQDRSFNSLLQNCPDLLSLSLAHLQFITDQVLTSMASKLKNLKILSLNGCQSVGDNSLIAISENCPQLQCLSLFSLPISDRAVMSIAQNCRNIISLSISGCTNVSDAGALDLSKLVNLQSLYLNGARITDVSVVAIAYHCKQIRALSLNDCTSLTDKSFVSLSKYCTSIQSLSANSCQVSAVGIRALVDRCVDLKEISVKDCQNCVLFGTEAQKIVAGNGGMHTLYAIGEQVLSKIKKRRIALIYN